MLRSMLNRILDPALRFLFRRSLPSIDGVFKAEELEHPEDASIERDEYGIPHLRARSEKDLWFLQGVVHGQDRLWQLHGARMLAQGRLCEFVGEKALDLDRLARQLGFLKIAEREWDNLVAAGGDDKVAMPVVQMLKQYTAGVNFAMKETKRMPVEFWLTGQHAGVEAWTEVHSLAVCRLYCFVMCFGFQQTLLRQALVDLFGEDRAFAWTCTEETNTAIPHTVSPEAAEAFRRANFGGVFNAGTASLPRGQGSNWWVVAGQHTQSGKPLLVGDPHLAIKIPMFWYEVRLRTTPGQNSSTKPIDAYGCGPPGIPGIFVGHTDFFATSITLGYCDVEDIFLEQLREVHRDVSSAQSSSSSVGPADIVPPAAGGDHSPPSVPPTTISAGPSNSTGSSWQYLYQNNWVPCEECSEELIFVKNRPDPVRCLYRRTRHGVVLDASTVSALETSANQVLKRHVVDSDRVGDSQILPGACVCLAYAGVPLRAQPAGESAISTIRNIFFVRSFADFDRALAPVSRQISLNFAYADVEGHIGYVLAGEVPVRRCAPGKELLPLIGWTGENDWISFVPHADLPRCLDPAAGYIISANHKILDYSAPREGRFGEDAVYLGRVFKSGYRAQTIQEELEKLFDGGKKIEPGDMKRLLMNVRSCAAQEFVTEMRCVRIEDSGTTTTGEESAVAEVDHHVAVVVRKTEMDAALACLASWDGVLSADSVVATLYNFLHSELVVVLLKAGCKAIGAPPDLPDEQAFLKLIHGNGFDATETMKIVSELQGHLHLNLLRILRSEELGADNDKTTLGRRWWLAQAGGRDMAVTTALRLALLRMKRLVNPENPQLVTLDDIFHNSLCTQWGQVHANVIQHTMSKALGLPPARTSDTSRFPLDAPTTPSDGDTNTICNSSTKSLLDWSATASNVSLRLICDLADLKNPATNLIITPLGQSGQFNSAHYCDQNAMWRSGGFRSMRVDEDGEDVEAPDRRRTMRFA